MGGKPLISVMYLLLRLSEAVLQEEKGEKGEKNGSHKCV